MRRRRSPHAILSGRCFQIAVALLLMHSPGAGAVDWADDDEVVADVRIVDEEDWLDPFQALLAEFDSLHDCCRDESALAETVENLTTTLKGQLSPAEWACELTDSQKEKLTLAGRGDIKHLMNRIGALQHRIEALPKSVDERTLLKLTDETAQLQTLLDTTPFGACSLFAKTLHATLTSDQLESYEAFHEIVGEEGWQSIPTDNPAGRQGLRLNLDEFPEEKLCILPKLKGLRSLTLDGPFVIDEVLPHLAGLAHLEQLDLSQSLATDDSLRHVTPLTSLQCLRLDGSWVTGAGCEHLQHLHHLTDLSLLETEVGDDDLVHLEKLRNLRKLNLAGTKVSDAGLVHLRALTSLEWLNLADTDVTNAGLNDLKRIRSLTTLHCPQTAVTESGVALLKRWRPGLKVER